jgi:hypothetical protein
VGKTKKYKSPVIDLQYRPDGHDNVGHDEQGSAHVYAAVLVCAGQLFYPRIAARELEHRDERPARATPACD